MKVRFLEVAEAELDRAIVWYESQSPGLGSAFLLDVLAATRRISSYPDAWQSLQDDIRRCRLARFPYGLVYVKESGEIIVLAVAHLHRKPEHWRRRSD